MSRERNRIMKKRESNPIAECNKIQKKFYPDLFSKFDRVKDPRHSSYIEYSCLEMLGTLYYKGIVGISSMQEMTRDLPVKPLPKTFISLWERKQRNIPRMVLP